jgi:hypothetical protein
VSSIENLQTKVNQIIDWFDYDSGSGCDIPNRLSIYDLEEKELTWENINVKKEGVSPTFIKKSAPYNKWVEEDISFIGDWYSIGEIFDNKERFKSEFRFYFGIEYIFAYFDTNEVLTKGLARDIFGELFMRNKFSEWVKRVKERTNELINCLRKREKFGHIKIKIPLHISKSKKDFGYGEKDVVGITITDEGEVLETLMDRSECLKYIRRNYPNRREIYYNEKWNSAFVIEP